MKAVINTNLGLNGVRHVLIINVVLRVRCVNSEACDGFCDFTFWLALFFFGKSITRFICTLLQAKVESTSVAIRKRVLHDYVGEVQAFVGPRVYDASFGASHFLKRVCTVNEGYFLA